MAGGVAWLARRAGSLSASGQWAAALTGTLVTLVGWRWAWLLIGYFVGASALTHLGRARKRARTAGMLDDAGARRAAQVAANGGVYVSLLLLGSWLDRPALLVAAVGALAAAAADTAATEVGTLWGGVPRSILTMRPVGTGASGGVTWAGSLASAGAAALLAGIGAPLAGTPGAGVAILIAGAGGSLADSLLGATLQSKRWCAACGAWTEREVHACGTRTAHANGVRWMTNDAVNLFATVVGAVLALILVGASA